MANREVLNRIDASVNRVDMSVNRLIASLRNPHQKHRQKPKLTVVGGSLTLDFPNGISITTNLQSQEKNKMANRTITVPDNTPDGTYSLAPISQAFDAEGNPVAYTEKFESSDPSIVSVTPTDPTNLHAGATHYGNPGVAVLAHTVTAKVGRKDEVTVVDTTTIVVTTGSPVTFVGGEASFFNPDGTPIEPDPAAPAV